MKLFSVKTPTSLTPLPRRTITDVSAHLYKIYEELHLFNRRLSSMAAILGGPYPSPASSPNDAPEDICGRMFFDIDNISSTITEMEHHISQLETITGLKPLPEEPDPKANVVDPPFMYDPNEEAPSA